MAPALRCEFSQDFLGACYHVVKFRKIVLCSFAISSQRHSLGSLFGFLVALFDVSSNREVSLDSMQRTQLQCTTLVCQMVSHMPNEKTLVLFWLIDCKLIKYMSPENKF